MSVTLTFGRFKPLSSAMVIRFLLAFALFSFTFGGDTRAQAMPDAAACAAPANCCPDPGEMIMVGCTNCCVLAPALLRIAAPADVVSPPFRAAPVPILIARAVRPLDPPPRPGAA